MSLTHIKSNDNHWTVVIKAKPYNFDQTHLDYEGLVKAVMNGKPDEFLELFNQGKKVIDWSKGNFNFVNGFLYYGDEQVASQPTERIINLIKNGWSCDAMLAYLNNLYQNVSNRAIHESYSWCSHKGLPITEDGYLVGYKGVSIYQGQPTKDLLGRDLKSGDLVDKYTKKSFRNNTGDVNFMPRRKVSDDCRIGCASGLHVGTYEYACNWAGNGPVILVSFNPADIVSVPSESSHQKMRVCKYEVLAIARFQLVEEVFQDYEDDYDYNYLDEDYLL